MLKDGYTYSLEYKIVPSAKAYEEYAANVNAGKNGYGDTKGDDDTGASSARQSGFRSNERATIDYTPRVDGEQQGQSKALNTRTRSSRSILRSLPG